MDQDNQLTRSILSNQASVYQRIQTPLSDPPLIIRKPKYQTIEQFREKERQRAKMNYQKKKDAKLAKIEEE